MNTGKYLILNNGKDITADVEFCQYNSKTGKYDVTFHNGKTYNYGYQSIEWVKNPEVLNPALVHLTHDGHELFKIQSIVVFHAKITDYWHVCFSNGSERSYDKQDIEIVASCLDELEAKNCKSYLQQQASINELKSEDGNILLQKQYEKLDFVGKNTSMAIYLNPKEHIIHTYHKSNLIFPFGGNASQFKAVANALNNQISVIQGPPGTGKTQTILNIIANLLVDGKTVQIVSSNNSATTNVLEKLSSSKYNLGFLVAPLGNSNNKKSFIQTQTGFYPDLSSWRLDSDIQSELQEKIQSCIEALSDIFDKQVHLSQIRQELDALLLETKYFQQYCSEIGFFYSNIRIRHSLKSKRLMQLWQECNKFSEEERAVSLWFKIKSIFIYGISDWDFYKNDPPKIITLLQSLFYQARKSELGDEISTLERQLKVLDAKEEMHKLIDCSMKYMRAKLFERYGNKPKREVFTEEDLWKNSNGVIKEYPIVLSTTFSSRSSLKNVMYNYLIMDETSQVDVATGALALSCTQNAVIVGDLRQLPNVVKNDIKKRSDAIFNSYKLPYGYSFSGNSFLKSICSILPNAPQTLLREHYRCHPKIIGFCNQKFYNNSLVIMTEDHGEPDTMAVIKTAVGNHQRDHINQRQSDVTVKDALPLLKNARPEDIGIIAPYKDQVAVIANQLGNDKIEVNTVHKFQGREKDTIVLNTVDDVVTDFSDDPYLLNVAVSRAKKRFLLVVSGNEQPRDSNINDLISYIEYNNFQIAQSEIYSVFDLLYSQYTDARIAFLRKHSRVSEYDSENLMYGAIVDMLHNRSQLHLNVICHQPLNMLIRDPQRMNDEERRYAMNTATHIDFLIYNRIRKKTVLAIEVDGFHYHKPGTLQYKRDLMKNHILELYKIPLMRFPTNGSDEIAKISQALDEYEKTHKS